MDPPPVPSRYDSTSTGRRLGEVANEQVIRSRLVNIVLCLCSVFALPVLVGCFFRSLQHGPDPILLTHIPICASLVVGAAFRRRLPYRLRVLVVVGAGGFAAGTSGLYSYGLNANGILLLATFVALTTAFLGTRAGLLAMGASLCVIVPVGIAVCAGKMTFRVPIEEYSTSTSAWAMVFLGFAILTTLTVVVSGSVHTHLRESLSSLRERTVELEAMNEQLRVEINERKRTEERLHQMESQLAHAFRLSVMGEMLAGVAHEMSQPLFTMLNLAKANRNVLADRLGPEFEQLREWNDGMIVAANQAGGIITRLRDFAQPHESQCQPVPVNEIIEESLELVAFDSRQRRIRLRRNLPDACPEVDVDRVQIQQVLVNLLKNAFEALDAKTPEARCVTVQAEDTGELVAVSVGDNGPGLPPSGELTVFKTFFTTKSTGLGMGLAISKTITERHGGRLWATSNRDGGATFHLTLPIANLERANEKAHT